MMTSRRRSRTMSPIRSRGSGSRTWKRTRSRPCGSAWSRVKTVPLTARRPRSGRILQAGRKPSPGEACLSHSSCRATATFWRSRSRALRPAPCWPTSGLAVNVAQSCARGRWRRFRPRTPVAPWSSRPLIRSATLNRSGTRVFNLSFTHISLLTEVLTVINLTAIFNNTVHLFELSTEQNEHIITI